METAVQLLTKSTQLAAEYQANTNKKVTMLQSLVRALDEDIQFVLSFKEPNKMLDKPVADALALARVTRRELERQIIEKQPEPAAAPSAPTTTQVVDRVATAMMLPQVKLPKFNGELARFRLFYDTFVDTVQRNPNLAAMTKWVHLKNSLEGKALELIRSIPETPDTLAIALKLLYDTYGSEERAITELYQRLQQMRPATMAADSLRTTFADVEGLLMSLEQYKQDVEGTGYLRSVVFGKFPPDVVFTVTNGTKMPLSEFRTRLSAYIISRESTYDQMVHTAQSVTPASSSRSVPSTPRDRARQTSRSAGNTPQRTARCVFCEAEHWSDECPTYTSLEQRRQRVAHRCHRCLRLAHPGTNCHTDRRCFHCDAFDHNRALCPKKAPPPAKATYATIPITLKQEAGSSELIAAGDYWTLRTYASSAAQPEKRSVRIFIDPGSKPTLISRKLAENMGLRKQSARKHKFVGLGSVPVGDGYKTNDVLTVYGFEGQPAHLQPYIVDHIADDLPAPDVSEFRRNHTQFGHLFIPPTGQGDEVDILIGSDDLLQVLRLGGGLEVDKSHQLLGTIFGHIIVTSAKKENIDQPLATMFTRPVDNVQLMYDLDALGLRYVEQSEEKEELEAIQKFYATIKFIEDRYEVSWPWRYYPPLLDTNYGLALGRLRSLHKQLQHKPEVLLQYHKIIMEQVDQQIAEPVLDRWPKGAPVHYLPHHPVVKTGGSTSVRPVYDASTTGVARGSSLNDNMLKGTKWLTDLVGVLLRFREDRVALTADIERAFHQISIRKEDRDVVRFIWLVDPLKPPTPENLQVYRFTRVAFGIVSSPFLLNATIHYHAEHHPNEFTPVVLNNLYADNLVTTLPPTTSAISFYDETKKFFASMGMNLRQWATNCPQLQRHLPAEDRLAGDIQPILGLRWNIVNDTMRLKTPNFKHASTSRLTKRVVMSQAAAVYDPLGWATPITLTAKLFIRKIWQAEAKWDQILLTQVAEQWTTIFQQLQRTEDIELQRIMFPQISSAAQTTTEFHVFVDASGDAYAVVIYAIRKNNESAQAAFIASKNRLVPKAKLTIPRLELLAVLTGCRYAAFVATALQWPTVTTYVWTDSKCVLAWINSARLQPPIIQRQITEIKKHNVEKFLYVPSELNRADVATRGATYQELKEMDWWTTPAWLKNVEEWPQQTQLPEPQLHEITHQPVMVITAQQQKLLQQQSENNDVSPINLDIKNYSTLLQLIRVTAQGIRFLNSFKSHTLRTAGIEGIHTTARRAWIKWDQRRVYPEVLKKEANMPFSIRNIRVFVDNEGIIRCYSRIKKSTLAEQNFYPILLIPGSKLTHLIVLNKHDLNYHAGTAQTLAAIRKEYWLPQGRRQVYSIVSSNCFQCRRQTAPLYPNPPPAPLPEFRVTQSTRPFEGTALDICGPFIVRGIVAGKQEKQKRWIIVFTCTRIRAVHLETLADLTTVEILDAFRKFTARRGTPKLLLSDNAPQFHALNGIFQKLWHTLAEQPSITNYLVAHEIQWKFLPPESPWMGGVHERVIQIVKACLERTYGNRVMLDRQFNTTVIEIEGIVNTRPLTYVDQNIDTKIITPNDFLAAKFPAMPLDAVELPNADPVLHLWKSSQKYLDEFWMDWSRMYLAELRHRDDKLKHRKHNSRTAPQKGDIVLIAEPEKKRSSWQIAVVERLIASDDGVVRSAQLRLPDPRVRQQPDDQIRIVRPIIKLAPLGLTVDLPQVSDDQITADRTAIELRVPEGVVDGDDQLGDVDIANETTTIEPSSQASDGTIVEEIELDVSDWDNDDESDDERFQMAEDRLDFIQSDEVVSADCKSSN